MISLLRNLIVAAAVAVCSIAVSGAIIPAQRLVTWQGNVGVRGGIPAATTIYTTLANTSTSAQINTAITNASAAYVSGGSTTLQVVKLDPGTFVITTPITLRTGVVLRGNSMTGTTLQGSGVFVGTVLLQWNNSFDDTWSVNTAKTLTAPTKGDTTLTTTTAHGWAAGDMVLVDMLQQPSGDPPISNTGNIGTPATWLGRASGTRCAGQLVEILTTPTTTTATISTPLVYSYNNTPQAIKASGLTKKAGLENLTIDNLLSGAAGGTSPYNGKDTVGVFGAVDCWMSGVKIYGNWRRAVWAYASMYFTYSSCWIEGGIPIGTDAQAQYGSDRAYGIFLGPWASEVLIEHNVFAKLSNTIAFEGCISGSAIGYNYCTEAWWQAESDKPYRFSIISHGANPMYMLIEGNWSSTRIRFDYSWGTGTYATVLRNRIQATSRGSVAAQRYTFDVEKGQWYHSVVGNIIGGGTGGVTEGRYQYTGETRPYEASTAAIQTLGYYSAAVGDNTNFDQGVVDSILQWRNWVYRMTNASAGSGVVNNPANVVNTGDTTVPNSYYYGSRPSWATKWWPVYDPDVPTDGIPDNLPAYALYTATTYPDYTPTGLGVGVDSSSSLTLTWADNATGETGYVIERSPDNVTYTQVGTAAAGATTYANTGLSASTLYYYRVAAYNGVTTRTSPYSSVSSATTSGAAASSTGGSRPGSIIGINLAP